jgi:lipopolysaccharide export system protein LptA
MRSTIALLILTVVLPLADVGAQTPATAPAQANRRCRLVNDPAGVTTRAGTVISLLNAFEVICTDGAEVRASSGTYDEATGIVSLAGNVFFQDPTRTMTSERAIYDTNVARLNATGNVVFTDRVEGTTLRGPELEYFGVIQGRPEALVNAMGRPHLTLQRPPPPDAPAPDSTPPPLEIDGDRMTIVGQNDLTVLGNVLIEDPSMRALADEAEHRGVAETLELRGNAQIHSREYSLTGETIFARVPGGSLSEVEARGRARMLGQDLNVAAPGLDLRFENDLLQRTVARSDPERAPGQRPVATSPTFNLEADSIDAILPGQRLEMVVAIGNARGDMIDTTRANGPGNGVDEEVVSDSAVSIDGADAAPQVGANETPAVTAELSPDSSRAVEDSVALASAGELVENDWIVGDTITGYFTAIEAPAAVDTVTAGPDGITEPVMEPGALTQDGARDTTLVMERMVARGAAQSLYHVAPEAGSEPGTLPGINFLSAAVIELLFADGQVQVADVSGLRRGLYLEPLAADAEPPEAGEGGEGEQAEPSEEPNPEPDEPAPSGPVSTPPENGVEAELTVDPGAGR